MEREGGRGVGREGGREGVGREKLAGAPFNSTSADVQNSTSMHAAQLSSLCIYMHDPVLNELDSTPLTLSSLDSLCPCLREPWESPPPLLLPTSYCSVRERLNHISGRGRPGVGLVG